MGIRAQEIRGGIDHGFRHAHQVVTEHASNLMGEADSHQRLTLVVGVAQDYVARYIGVDTSMVSNMTCLRTNATTIVGRRRLDEAAAEPVCYTNVTRVVSYYSVTVVVRAEINH